MICGIYKITSPSGKCYIGQSVKIEKRWSSHCNKKNCSPLKSAIEKHGRDNMKFEIIQELPKNKVVMNSYEIYFIELYNSVSPNGYNLKTGGVSCLYSEETKQKMSNSQKGKPKNEETKRKISNSQKGKTHTEETRRKNSEANKGENNPMYGKNHTEETKKKMSEASKGQVAHNKGKRINKETRKYEEINIKN